MNKTIEPTSYGWKEYINGVLVAVIKSDRKKGDKAVEDYKTDCKLKVYPNIKEKYDASRKLSEV